MKNGFYLITGTSRGIGEALAQKLLKQENTVLGVSRQQSKTLKSDRYHHLSYDLADSSGLEEIVEKAGELVGGQEFDFLCLVNNAAAVEPLGPIERAGAMEIESHLRIGLLAPMILTSAFVRKFAVHKARKKVAFISSGVAVHPMQDMSLYCSSKAGLHMFAQCIGLEQDKRENGFEIVSISPGKVETAMQQAVRTGRYAMAEYFQQAYESGELQDRSEVVEKIAVILANKYENEVFVSVKDV